MYIIAGLGNIGSKFENTKHNIGFMVVDYLAQKYGLEITKSLNKGLYAQGYIANKKVMLLKPQTYMNLSGECIGPMARYFDVESAELLVIYDDVDFDIGVNKLRKSGSAGTHNGMKDIVRNLGDTNFPRLRMGVGNNKLYDLADYVLAPFDEKQIPVLNEQIRLATECVEEFIANGIDVAMNKYNNKKIESNTSEN